MAAGTAVICSPRHPEQLLGSSMLGPRIVHERPTCLWSGPQQAEVLVLTDSVLSGAHVSSWSTECLREMQDEVSQYVRHWGLGEPVLGLKISVWMLAK